MKKANKKKSSQFVAAPAVDDVPEALRDAHVIVKRRPRRKLRFLLTGLVGLSAIALSIGVWYLTAVPQKNATSTLLPESSSIPQKSLSVKTADTILGHFAYAQAPLTELSAIIPDGRIQMRKAAARKFLAMVAAARAQGVILVPISGFRSIKQQEHLFFDIKAQRGQVTAKRASVSAPPGYSEHHTGYAVDIGDGAVPAMNLSPTFENTKAFKWLAQNAARYSFEMSFPRNNEQGVSYEPWHWRYVGDRDSLETFYKAKNMQPTP